MATEVSSSQISANHHQSQPQQQQQAPSSQAQPRETQQQQSHQTHQSQGGLSSTHVTSRQYTATSRPSRGNRGYGYHNNSSSRSYNNERNQQDYGSGVKVHYTHSMSGHQNPNRFPIMRHFNNGATNVTLTPINPSFTLSNQLAPATSATHFPQSQFSSISSQSSFEETGHSLLQNPGQNFDPQQQPGQVLVPHRNQMQWSNTQIPTSNGVIDQQHPEMNGGGVFGENSTGNYQGQQMQQQQAQQVHQQPPPQFPPAQTYFPYPGQFGSGQTSVNPNMFLPQFSHFYGNPSAQNFIPGFGHFQPQFVNPSGYGPYGNSAAAAVAAASAATGNGHGVGPFICSVCKQQMQANEPQSVSEMAATDSKASIESTHE